MKREEQSFLTEVSYLYYKKQYSQEKIAKKMFVSRSTVSRALQKAIENGIIEIKINYPHIRNSFLESEIINRFKVNNCYVLVTEKNMGFEQLTQYAANKISSYMRDDSIFGISSGSTVREVCNNIRFDLFNNVVLSQIKGNAGISSNYSYDSPSTILTLANEYKMNFNLIYSPLYVFSKTVREFLKNELIVKESLEIAKKSDIIISSVGIPEEDEGKIYSNYINSESMKSLFDKKPLATFIGHFLDGDGKSIDKDFEKSIIGLSLEDIKNIENTIVVVYGEEKYRSLYSVLKAGLVNTLFVDEQCAEALINYRSIK